MSYPQRIYVLPAQPRQVVKRQVPTDLIVAELLGDEMGPSGPRKRERLTHLTQEEKLERRKMKNRVAAQNARDKKKDRSAKIEDVMRDLVEENRRLRAENEMLRRQCQERQENHQEVYSNVVYEEEVVGEVDEHRAFESAVGTGPMLEDDQCRQVPDYPFDPLQPSEQHFEPVVDDFQPASTDFGFVGYAEDGDECYPSSCSTGSFATPPEACEALSPGSLALSPSMSASSTEWDYTPADEEFADVGNWNFDDFDESSIDLNFFRD